MNKKITLSFLGIFALVGLFASANIVSADNAVPSCNSAILYGTVTPNGSSTEAWFIWGPTPDMPYQTPHQTFAASAPSTSFSQVLTPLTESSTYYWQAMAKNSFGVASGVPKTFQTSSCAGTPTNNPPTASLSANPSTITAGQQSTLSWSSTNATSCSAPWTSSTATSGSQIVSPATTTFYNINCVGGGGTASFMAQVFVNATPVQTCQTQGATNIGGPLPCQFPPAPTCQTQGASNIGGSLPCQFPPQLCVNTQASNYGQPLPCQFPAPQVCNDATATNYLGTLPCQYQPRCQDPSATNYNSIGQCQYPQRCTDPTATNYNSIGSCQYQQRCLDVTATNYNSIGSCQYQQRCLDVTAINYGSTGQCQYQNFNNRCNDPSATNYLSFGSCVYQQTTCNDYTATNYGSYGFCRYGNGGQAPIVNIYANSTNVASGQSTTITWATSYANTCYASGGSNGWGGTKNTSGTFYTGALYGTTTYSINCTGYNSGSNSASVTVYVNGTTGTTTYNVGPTAVTTIPSQLSNTSAQLNGLIFTGGYSTDAWFEWGTTASLGNRTASIAMGTASSVRQSDTISGLATGVTYFYRSVAQNIYGTSYGNIMSFPMSNLSGTVSNVASTVVNRTTVINNGTAKSLVMLTIDGGIDTIRPSETRNYDITWKNTSTQNLTKVVLQVILPDTMNFQAATRGSYSSGDHKLTLDLGTLSPSETGSMSMTATANSTLTAGKLIVIVANLVYTDQSGNQGQAVAYATHNPDLSQSNNLGANAFGAGFLPSTFLGWLFLIILLLVIIFLSRHIYNQSRGSGAVPPPAPPYGPAH